MRRGLLLALLVAVLLAAAALPSAVAREDPPTGALAGEEESSEESSKQAAVEESKVEEQLAAEGSEAAAEESKAAVEESKAEAKEESKAEEGSEAAAEESKAEESKAEESSEASKAASESSSESATAEEESKAEEESSEESSAGLESADTLVDESLRRMQRLHKEQQRLNRLQVDMNTRMQRIQAEFQRVAAAQHDVNRHAHELKQKELLVGAEEATNRERARDLHMAVGALTAEQSRLMHDQFALQHLQQLLTMVGNPAYAQLVPSMDKGMVVNPNLVDQLLGEDDKLGAELAVGRYTLEGRTRNERTGQEVAVEVRMALHTDGTVTGSTEYAPHAKKSSRRVRIQLVGTWSPRGLVWVEEFNNRAFLFNGTFDADRRRVTGAYEFPRDGGAAPARGTFVHAIHKYRIPAGKGYLPPDFFRNEPGLETPHRKAPAAPGRLEPGFYVVSGSTESEGSSRTHSMPDMLFHLQAGGAMTGKTAYLQSKHAHMGGHALSAETVVRMTGTWDREQLSYVFLYGGRVFKFNGTVGVGSLGGLQGQFTATRAVSASGKPPAGGAATAHGTFQFVARRIVFETKDHMAPVRFRALYDRADDLSQPPLEHAPAGKVFDYYAGAAPSLAEVTAHGLRVGALPLA